LDIVELRDPDSARTYILQGLWLQRVIRPTATLVKPALEWALEIAASGQALPPVGFVADLGNVAYGLDRGRQTKDAAIVPGWPTTLARSYEDHFLGKVYADWTFERAVDALRRYSGREQAKGLAYVVKQIRERGKLGGVELSPPVIAALLPIPGEQLLAMGQELLTRDGPLPLLQRQYEAIVSAARRLAEVLGPEDVIALEQRTALADMGQYVAHRQILVITARLEARLPPRPVKPLVGRKEVPTRVMDEDQYPVGGYTSISTKGSIESLLHSQLAYMEEEQPDLFDMKFVRDELFYYSRDENQFLRRRRIIAFVFDTTLTETRFKDAELPVQRIVMVLSLVLTLVRKMTDWLSSDALRFELIFLQTPEQTTTPLKQEMELLQLLLREPLERGSASVRLLPSADAAERFLDIESRTSQVHVLDMGLAKPRMSAESLAVTTLKIPGSRPELWDNAAGETDFAGEDAFDDWVAVAHRLLELWV
jgi:vWA domain found in the FtsH ternary systems/N-terminal helical region fused to the FtsH ternary system vWA domain